MTPILKLFLKYIAIQFHLDHLRVSGPNSDELVNFKDKILIWLTLFQLLNFHLWQAAHCTLHTAQFTLRTVPAPENAPKTSSVHLILTIEHFALHTIHFYCMLQIYHYTLKHPKMASMTLKMYMAKRTLIYSIPKIFQSSFEKRLLSNTNKSLNCINKIFKNRYPKLAEVTSDNQKYTKRWQNIKREQLVCEWSTFAKPWPWSLSDRVDPAPLSDRKWNLDHSPISRTWLTQICSVVAKKMDAHVSH